MSIHSQATLAPMVRKLQLWKDLAEEEQVAVLALPHEREMVAPGNYIVREGEQAKYSCLLLSGVRIPSEARP